MLPIHVPLQTSSADVVNAILRLERFHSDHSGYGQRFYARSCAMLRVEENKMVEADNDETHISSREVPSPTASRRPAAANEQQFIAGYAKSLTIVVTMRANRR